MSITPDQDMILEDFESKFIGIAREPAGTVATDHEYENEQVIAEGTEVT